MAPYRTTPARPALWAVLLFCTGALLAACTKPENELGLDILDPEDALGTVQVDTTSLITYTVEEPPLRSSALSRNALGSYRDVDLGTVTAGIVTQVRLGSNNVGAGADNHALVPDSLVLSLVFDANSFAYGNLDPQRIRVFELTGDLFPDTLYRTSDAPPVAMANDLVVGTRGAVTPDPFRAVYIGNDTLKPQVRIPLDLALAERLLNAWGTADLADNTAFLRFFKGLYIAPEEASGGIYQGGIWYFDLLDAQSKLTLYYRNTAPGAEDTLSYDLVINSSCARYTHCTHDFSTAYAPALPNSLADSTLGQHTVFAQGLAGTRTEVRLPNLQRYAETGQNAVAKAELVVPLADAFYPYYQPPSLLFVFRKGDEGQDLFLPEQTTNSVGGTYDPVNKEYRMNITRWVQRVLTGEYANTGLSLVPSGNGVSADRVVLGGAAHPEHPMRLLLTFTTY